MSHRFYSLPVDVFVETFSEWETKMEGSSGNPVFSFALRPARIITTPASRRGIKEPLKVGDAFEIRKRFFGISKPQDALEFFRQFGPWQVAKYLDNQAASITFSALNFRREYYRDVLLSSELGRKKSEITNDPIRESLEKLYLLQNLPMELVFRQPPVALVRCKDIEDALRASVLLDKLDALPWRLCACDGCGKPFKVEKDPRRRYCDSVCARLQASRDYNERNRNKQRGGIPPRKKRVKKNGDF